MYQNYTIGQTEFVLNYNYDLPQNHVARLISDFVDSIPQDVLLEDSERLPAALYRIQQLCLRFSCLPTHVKLILEERLK